MYTRKRKRNSGKVFTIASAVAALVLLTVGVAIGESPSLNRLSHLVVESGVEASTFSVATTTSPTYTVFRLKNPNRLPMRITLP